MEEKLSFEEQIQMANHLNQTLDEIINESEKTSDFYYNRDLVEKSEKFKVLLEDFFDKNSKISSAKVIKNLTSLCQKANVNKNVQKLFYLIERNKFFHSKVMFLKLTGKNDILDENCELEFKDLKKHTVRLIDLEKSKHKSHNSADLFVENMANVILTDKNEAIMLEARDLLDRSLSCFVNDHNVDKPMKFLHAFYDMENKYKTDDFLSKFFKEITEKNRHTLYDIQFQFDIVSQLIKEANEDNWIHETTKKNINVSYRMSKESHAHTCSLKFETELNISLLHLISIIYDSDLMHLWVPFCKIGRTVKKINKACKVFYNEMNLPIISNRELYSFGFGINKLDENGSIYIISKTIDKDQKFLEYNNIEIPAKSKSVRMEVNYFAIEITPYSINHCKVRMVTNLDPKLKIIPYAVINFVVRKFAVTIFEKILNKASNDFEKSPWFESMNSPENKDFFLWCEKIIKGLENSQEL